METLILQMNPPLIQELVLGKANTDGNATAFMDTTANWAEKTQYIPNKAVIIIYSDAFEVNGEYVPGIKIGDGLTLVGDLPFVNNAYEELPDKPQINGVTLVGNKQLSDLFSDGIIIDGGGA